MIATVSCRIAIQTDGKLEAVCGGGTSRFTAGSVADGLVHRVDSKLDTSSTAYALDVDGST
jgi:hypothetical protein